MRPPKIRECSQDDTQKKVVTCHFSMMCSSSTCEQKNNYSDEMVPDQLVQGLNYDETHKKALAYDEDEFNIDNIKQLMTTEECGKATQKDSKARDHETDLAPASTYKKDWRN